MCDNAFGSVAEDGHAGHNCLALMQPQSCEEGEIRTLNNARTHALDQLHESERLRTLSRGLPAVLLLNLALEVHQALEMRVCAG